MPKLSSRPERVHARLMSVLPGGQGLLVVFSLARRRQEHPHHQLSRFDCRIVPRPQQQGPLHRSDAEALPHLMVDGQLQLFKLGLIHVGLHPRLPSQRRPPPAGFHVGARPPDLSLIKIISGPRQVRSCPRRRHRRLDLEPRAAAPGYRKKIHQ
jgi:hypothetical protein